MIETPCAQCPWTSKDQRDKDAQKAPDTFIDQQGVLRIAYLLQVLSTCQEPIIVNTKMKVRELKRHVEATGSHFFSRECMRLFGDTMHNYGVHKKTMRIKTWATNEVVECWVLYRKAPVKYGLYADAYFAVDDYRRIFISQPVPSKP